MDRSTEEEEVAQREGHELWSSTERYLWLRSNLCLNETKTTNQGQGKSHYKAQGYTILEAHAKLGIIYVPTMHSRRTS